MSSFRVLSANPSDRTEWMAAWAITGREPYAHPSYVQLFAIDGASAHCAVAATDSGVAVLPFLLRPVDAGSLAPNGGVSDAVSPYGYGGPYGTSHVDFSDLWVGMASWLRQRGVVSFFGRLALGQRARQGLPRDAVVVSDNDNVVVSLSRSADEQWRVYDHKVRKNVNKARRSGLVVEIRDTYSDVSEFTHLYHSTMGRRGASQWYYFEEGFFHRIATDLPDSHIVAEVRDEVGTLVSAELVLTSDEYCYSYLGGTLAEAFAMRPNDLLKHAVISFGRTAGLRGYVLGGGLSRGDGLFRYKKAFDPEGVIPYNRLHWASDGPTYLRMVQHREASAANLGQELERDFFPGYRAPFRQNDEELS